MRSTCLNQGDVVCRPQWNLSSSSAPTSSAGWLAAALPMPMSPGRLCLRRYRQSTARTRPHRAHLLPLTSTGEPASPPATVLPRSVSPQIPGVRLETISASWVLKSRVQVAYLGVEEDAARCQARPARPVRSPRPLGGLGVPAGAQHDRHARHRRRQSRRAGRRRPRRDQLHRRAGPSPRSPAGRHPLPALRPVP